MGAYAAEMIARAGVGRMTIADADTVAPNNINRQLVALHSTVGRQKAEVLAERLRDINPGIGLTVVDRYIQDEETYTAARRRRIRLRGGRHRHPLAQTGADKGCLSDRSLPLVSSMGAGAKTDPTKMEIADISKTHHCPLAHMLRKRLHKLGVRSGFKAVFSPEADARGGDDPLRRAEQEVERRHDLLHPRAVRHRLRLGGDPHADRGNGLTTKP